ncbi:MAG: hypothetical protein KBC72_04445 [Acinetobacter sp.]|nr:hypothetical protein [Acinetobacter sp.]
MKEWEQWISINKPKLIHVANFEERFVREILARIPEITPNDVTAQYHFQFPNGSNGYIDFCIKNDSKGYFVSIELDGAWKANASDFAALLERQNVMMASRIGSLLRFANSTWLGKSDQTIQTIRKVLEDQHKAFIGKVSTEDLVRQLKEMQDEIVRLKQQNSNNETAQLTAQLGDLLKQLQGQNVGSNTQYINTVMLGLAQEIKDLSQVPPVQSKQYIPLYIGIGLAVLSIGFGAYVHLTKTTKTDELVPRNTQAITQPLAANTSEHQPRRVPNTMGEALENAAYLIDGEGMVDIIPASEAKNYVGKKLVVCGYVAEIKTIKDRTYINMGNVYPNQEMAVIIWPDAARKFDSILNTIGGKFLCLGGEITLYKGVPQISLNDLSQIVE